MFNKYIRPSIWSFQLTNVFSHHQTVSWSWPHSYKWNTLYSVGTNQINEWIENFGFSQFNEVYLFIWYTVHNISLIRQRPLLSWEEPGQGPRETHNHPQVAEKTFPPRDVEGISMRWTWTHANLIRLYESVNRLRRGGNLIMKSIIPLNAGALYSYI